MDSWEKFLDPQKLRGSLLTCSMYIAAYEICKESIIDKLRSFYSEYWDKDGPHPGDEYRLKVLRLSKSPLQATLLWFQGQGAITELDIESISKARELRNQIAHDLPKFLSSSDYEIEQSIFDALLEVTHKIGVWWVINVEMETDPDYADKEVEEKDVQTGTLMFISMMMDIAYGNEPEEGYYLNAVKKPKRS